MAEILGLGVTHFPPLSGTDERMGRILKRALEDPAIPEPLRHPQGWPAPMRQEYGNDAGVSAAERHRAALLAGFRNARRRSIRHRHRILRALEPASHPGSATVPGPRDLRARASVCGPNFHSSRKAVESE